MPNAERHWLEANRSPLARYWNLLTGLAADQLSYARWRYPAAVPRVLGHMAPFRSFRDAFARSGQQPFRNHCFSGIGSTGYNGLAAEAPMTNVTVELSEREIEALKARTGKRSAAAALKAWAARANAKRSAAELRAALKDSLKEEAAGKGRRFDSGREAIRWLES
jgi:hypothetical protein